MSRADPALSRQAIYQDPAQAPARRAQALLEDLSPAEKLAQLQTYNPAHWSKAVLAHDFPLGAGQVAYLFATETPSLEQVLARQRDIQQRIMDLSPHRIPALFHLETHAGALLPQAASFPSGLAQGATFNPSLLQKMGELIGRQARAAGGLQAFSPVLDVNRDQRFGRCGESFGEDPVLVTALGMAVVRGLQQGGPGKGVLATAKHFLAYHQGMGGIHAAAVSVSPAQLAEVFAKPFQAAICQAGLSALMPSYGAVNGEPVSVSQTLLRELLRDCWGFEGLVVSDYSALEEVYTRQHVGESLPAVGAAALRAGVDQELPCPVVYSDRLLQLAANDPELLLALDQSVKRVLTAKFALGLFEQPLAQDTAAVLRLYQQPEARSLPREVAREAVVLLKNQDLLPLDRNNLHRLALIGPQANRTLDGFGGYTYASMRCGFAAGSSTMAGLTVNQAYQPDQPRQQVDEDYIERIAEQAAPTADTLYAALKKALPKTTITVSRGYDYMGSDGRYMAEALQAAAQAEVILLTVGGRYGSGRIATEGEGLDCSSLELPPAQERFITQAKALGKPIIVIHFGGHPLCSDAADQCAGAIIEAWTLGEGMGQVLTEILLGDCNPSGRLPLTVPFRTGQLPLYYSHPFGSAWHQGTLSPVRDYVDAPHQARYPFGFGLSCTSFSYTALKLNSDRISTGQSLVFSFDLSNTGSRAGAETVQIYIRDQQASVVRPNLQLLAFRKYHLAAGETVKACFSVPLDQLAFWIRPNRWKTEAGKIRLYIGASSADWRLQADFELMEDVYWEEKQLSFFEG
ncbi:beta-glucosidase [Oscillospiraceae bacterium HV4-5-C5C]|nr:beta-glucosidase [Oscillospiraceae bacterium HV4-5-C5C]